MRTLILALLLTVSAFAFADNEIYIEQVGEGVEIIIEQTGNGNLIGQNTNTGANATDMKLQIGNSNAYWLFNGSNNLLFGDINSDGSNIDYNLVGSNNRINQLIKKVFSYVLYLFSRSIIARILGGIAVITIDKVSGPANFYLLAKYPTLICFISNFIFYVYLYRILGDL